MGLINSGIDMEMSRLDEFKMFATTDDWLADTGDKVSPIKTRHRCSKAPRARLQNLEHRMVETA